MPLSEADTRAKFITRALHSRGWTEDLIKREESAGTIQIINGKPKKVNARVDYTLRVKITPQAQPVAVGVIEAKAAHFPPTHGLQQAKIYASIKRLNVPFAFSSNGRQFAEYDNFTGITNASRPMSKFPTPDELKQRYEEGKGIALDSSSAKPLVTPYSGGEGTRRYYQDAAIRAVLEKVAKGENRALLSLATGAGKTYIAVNLLKRIATSGQLRKALFLCDRDELRNQALTAFQNEFGSDAAAASNHAPVKNARVIIATYQTLGVDTEEGDASFLTNHYPENYFSHIVIDECHRSAWGKWSEVLYRNDKAVQIGLTATPRQFKYTEDNDDSRKDEKITADNVEYFGEPAYEYSIGQGIEDGYLAAMEIIRTDTFINRHAATERETGLRRADLQGTDISDAITGEEIDDYEIPDEYAATSFESQILLPDRIRKWCSDFFEHLTASGNPEQKTIIFCVRDRHADEVANELNNLYARWCADNSKPPAQDFAFKCTAASGKEFLADIRGSSRHHFIATTVDLLTTGVDVPPVVNIVFFRYVSSPISFYQMVGRGTRLGTPNKLMFRVYDYTNATRLFGEDFITKFRSPGSPQEPGTGTEAGADEEDKKRKLLVEGLEVRVSRSGTYILTTNDEGETALVTLEEYKGKLAAKLVDDIPSLDEFREVWVEPNRRKELIGRLPDHGRSPLVIRKLGYTSDYDLYDVIAEIGYGLVPKTKRVRAGAFVYKNKTWLTSLDASSAKVIKAIASQFAKGGTEGLENPRIFETPEVVDAGGIKALQSRSTAPKQWVRETKVRIFSA